MVKMTATKIISYIKRKLYQTQIFLRWFKELSKYWVKLLHDQMN